MGSKGLWFVICDCWISIRFTCFFVSRFATCNRNYDWRERKTKLRRRLLNFRVRVFLKSVVNRTNKSGTKLLLCCLPPRAQTLFFRTEASASREKRDVWVRGSLFYEENWRETRSRATNWRWRKHDFISYFHGGNICLSLFVCMAGWFRPLN